MSKGRIKPLQRENTQLKQDFVVCDQARHRAEKLVEKLWAVINTQAALIAALRGEGGNDARPKPARRAHAA